MNTAPKLYTLNEHGFTEQELYELENLIDRRGIEQFLMQLSEICGFKSQHIAENWQDKGLAKRWATLEGAIGCVVPKATGL